jgi:DNA-directed RNA polymerase specialized sigma24 family protein
MKQPTDDPAVGEPEPSGAGPFPATHWTLVLEAARGDAGTSQDALGRLCVMYREPIRSWLLRNGTSPGAVDDLTQRFVEHLLEGNRLKNVERRETKFRAYLIECLRRLVRGEWRKEMAAKRGGGVEPAVFDETIVGAAPAMDRLLDRDFAWAVHRQAVARLEATRFKAEPRRARFIELSRFIWGHDPDVSYAEVGVRLGMTANHVKKAVFDLRQDYYDSFREAVSQTVVPGLVDEETRYLLTLVAEGSEVSAGSEGAPVDSR